MQSISIIGIGRVGGALALALSRAGYKIDNLIHRSRNTADAIAMRLSGNPELFRLEELALIDSDIALITSGDNEIQNIADAIADRLKPETTVLHTSGSLDSRILNSVSSAGGNIGSLHPLVSISDPVAGAERFSGAFFCIEGDEKAIAAARSIAETIGGRPFSIETRFKPLYHASAVMACGHVVALIDASIEMLSKCGLEERRAKEVLLPLITSTIKNLETQAPAEALTGPFARADAAALERHLAAFEGEVPVDIKDIYLLLAERSLMLAEQRGTPTKRAEAIRKRISIAKRKREC